MMNMADHETDTDSEDDCFKLDSSNASESTSELEPVYWDMNSAEENADSDYEDESLNSNGDDCGLPQESATPNLQKIPFTGNPGLLVPIPGDNVMDFFTLFFDNELLQKIVDSTNAYAKKLAQSEETKKKLRITCWEDVTLSEFKVFLGLLLHMGNIKMERLQDYWKTDEFFNSTFFSKCMSKNRFLLIFRCLSFSYNQDPTQVNDRVHRVRLLQDIFNNKMTATYAPGKEMSVDECMSFLRRKLPFGLRLYLLIEPDEIVHRFHAYKWASDDGNRRTRAADVVTSLMEGKEHIGHALYMDKFFNSFPLSKSLLSKGIHTTGVLCKKSVGSPKIVVNAKLSKEELITRYVDGVSISKWKAASGGVTTFISTEFEGVVEEHTDRKGNAVKKPKALVEFKKFSSGIYRQDEMLDYYPCHYIKFRWFKKFGIHILSTLLQNSFILYNKHVKKMDLYSYRMVVIKSLLYEKLESPEVPMSNDSSSDSSAKYDKNSKGHQMKKYKVRHTKKV